MILIKKGEREREDISIRIIELDDARKKKIPPIDPFDSSSQLPLPYKIMFEYKKTQREFSRGNNISEGVIRKRSGGKEEMVLLRNGALNIPCRTTYRGCRCALGRSASPGPRPRPRAPLDA